LLAGERAAQQYAAHFAGADRDCWAIWPYWATDAWDAHSEE